MRWRGSESGESPYHIELWNDGKASDSQQVLARASIASKAWELFLLARHGYPKRHLVICRAGRIIFDSKAE